ncbi:oxidoreductase [Asanoa ishikariensis]|uniref:Short chain dehydrogenase n=1 Tax=Asanoa ishikariensis TaxID=137265 RepID=A0A1H3L903_9ACTN|nr:oxidoreductase [Asanoa ishikariensis]GIF65309.1 oxidoreductase [Asanoa ishikariensis]SDY60414.1 short chain dehydrogenase [Asanoa ishikariensis]
MNVAIITGGAAGIGYATAAGLAERGNHVVIAGRRQEALRTAADRLRKAYPGSTISTGELDLADLASVRSFAARVSAEHPKVDLLVNNAGVMAVPERRLTTDGFELTFGTNHLGHFALTGLLLPVLLAAEAPRVVTVSAAIARRGRIDLDNLDFHRDYRPMRAYSAAKLANVAFALELAARTDRLRSIAVHPGTAVTGIQRHVSPALRVVAGGLIALMGQSAEEAARPSLLAATDAHIASGAYFAPRGIGEGRGRPAPARIPAAAQDPTLRDRLWVASERLTGVSYHLVAPQRAVA